MTNKTYVIVDNGVVIGSAVWDGETEWEPEVGVAVLVPDGFYFNVGWLYDGVNFTDPNPDLPPSNFELYKQDVAARNAVYTKEVADMNAAWSQAGLFDGTSEAPKKSALQAKAIERRAQYLADLAQLKVQYGV